MSSLSTTFYSQFPGEDFLAVSLPDYEKERRQIVINIVTAVILFIFVLPFFLATKKTTTSSNGAISKGSVDQPATTTSGPHPSSKKSNKKRNGKKAKEQTSSSRPTTTLHQVNKNNDDGDDEPAVEFSATTSNLLTLLYTIVVFGILFFNDNNLFLARTILRAPIFTQEECQHIIDMANGAAERNANEAAKEREALLLENPEFMDLELTKEEEEEEKEDDTSNATTIATNPGMDPHVHKLNKLDSMLVEPKGWKKDRHNHYPTTDLNLVTDPFTSEDRAWLAHRLNARLTPLVERSFGIFRGAIRANDIFVVRYDASKGQPALRKHTDSSHLSFNVLLNDAFEGGGTRFHNRRDKTYIDVKPDVGEALISHAEILHEGLATTKGTRYILVGFDSIDEKDPLTGEPTNLSVFSSWLNFPWMQVRFKEGWQDGRKTRTRVLNNMLDDSGEWKYSRYAVGLFRDLDEAMRWLIDQFAPFRSLKVVDTEDPQKYFQVMDEAMERRNQEIEKPSRGAGYASWYKGQQIDLDVFGNFKRIWNSRSEKEDKFRGEDL